MKTARLMFVALFSCLLLASCEPSIPIATRLTSGSSVSVSARYRRLTEVRSELLVLERGEQVSVSYTLLVDSGSIHLSLVDPEENAIWQQGFEENADDAFTFTAEMDGVYQVNVGCKKTRGGYRLVCKNTGS